MPLYSTDALSNANEGKINTESDAMESVSEVEGLSKNKNASFWCYLFIHHAKVNIINDKLRERFNTFIHKSVVYKRGEKRVVKNEQPTISGLVFVQGESREIQNYLSDNFFGLYLVNDCSTGRTAVIPDCIMQSFMQVAQIEPNRIRFMSHPFDYYAKGHTLVRITSGVLAGLEGYQIRISRDKCLVTSMGGMTIAIGGIHKESFENVEEYVRYRREGQQRKECSADGLFSDNQAEIDKCFFHPHNQLDLMAIAGSLNRWIMKARSFVRERRFNDAIEIVFFILEEMGMRFQLVYNDPRIGNFRDIAAVCHDADEILTLIAEDSEVGTDVKEGIVLKRQSLAVRFPFLPIKV